jgi:nucleotide-binding universal stress UspA family protein
MYKRIVVPLDGSDLAELALPHLQSIAKGCSTADIYLISVTEMIKGRIGQNKIQSSFVPEKPVAMRLPAAAAAQATILFDVHEYGLQEVPVAFGKMVKTANDYLCRKAEQLERKGFRVTATVLMGDPAGQIIRFAKEKDADLIIMASTGKSKISKWDMSHISAKVTKDTNIPVLLVKPGKGFKETKPKRKGVAA